MASPTSSVAAALGRWRNNLLDLTCRNPLLTLRPTCSSSLTISHPASVVSFDALVRAGKSWSFWMPPAEEEDEEGTAPKGGLGRIQTRANELVCGDLGRRDLLRVLTNLFQRSRADFLERGLHILHVACGFLEWREDSGEALRSPLVLVPVALSSSSNRDSFTLVAADAAPVVNPALQARLDKDFGFRLPAPPENWDGKSLTSFLSEVEAAIAGLPGWRVDRGTALALFPFFKAAMGRDLQENAARIEVHPLVRALAGEGFSADLGRQPLPEEVESDPPQPPLTTFHILPVDDSQLLCLEAAAHGHSFALQGPPGSGKSQTIANLIADRLAAGKTVLFVSETLAHLNVVYQRLRAVGLGDFCLELHHHKANQGAVVAELVRCLSVRPQVAADLEAEDAKKQQQLKEYVTALHTVREPLRKSAWWAWCELARCEGLPHVPLGLDPADLTPARLDQAKNAMQRLQQLWHIPEQGPEYPWWGFKAEDRFTKKLREEMIALVERVRGRIDRLATIAQDYAAKIGVNGPVPWLLRIADALETSPGPPPEWLTADDLPEIAADIEHCAADYQQRGQSREPITARYGPDVWRLPTGTRANVEQSWQAVAPLLAPGDERGEGLLTRQQQLRGWAADTQRRIPGWISEARTLEKWLGLTLPRGAGAAPGANRSAESKEDPSVQILKRLHRLANLCVADNAPQRSWILDVAALEEARKVVASNRPVFADFNKRRANLLVRYTERLFELDLPGIAQRLAGPYRSWLCMFNMQFRRDRRALRRRCRTEVLPATWRQDVIAASDLVRQKASLDAEQSARQAVLGRYEKSLDTDFDAAERGTRIAAEAVELVHDLGCPSLPSRLVEALSATAGPSEKIRAALKRLHDSLGAWQHATDELKANLPMDMLPGTGVPLEESALSVLNDYARNLQTTLNQFAVASDPALAHARTRPADAIALLTDLRQVEDFRALEETQEQDNARWASRLGPEFKGVATNWKALRNALSWTTRMRELFKTGSSAGPLTEQFVKVVAGGASAAPSSRELRHAKDQLDQALHALENRFEPAPSWHGRRYSDMAPDEVTARIETLRHRVGELADWVDWCYAAERFAQLGLSVFWEGLQKERPPRDRLVDVFTRAAVGGWLDGIFQQDPALGAFRGMDQERLIAEFRDLDRRLLRLNAQRAVQTVASRRPQAFQAASDPQIALLNEALQKYRPVTAARLFEEVPELVLRLKPCWLMSPRSVSQFLPPDKTTFDVVVFDEASRIGVEDAVGGIYRARQMVVAGDDLQVPPANSFQGKDDGEAAGDKEGPHESLLSACLGAGLVQYTLRYHYGSDQELPAPAADMLPEPAEPASGELPADKNALRMRKLGAIDAK